MTGLCWSYITFYNNIQNKCCFNWFRGMWGPMGQKKIVCATTPKLKSVFICKLIVKIIYEQHKSVISKTVFKYKTVPHLGPRRLVSASQSHCCIKPHVIWVRQHSDLFEWSSPTLALTRGQTTTSLHVTRWTRTSTKQTRFTIYHVTMLYFSYPFVLLLFFWYDVKTKNTI